MSLQRTRQSDTRNRRGVAAVEFAVCLPIIAVLVIGTIEACSMVYLKQSVTISAYEGIRTAIAAGATESDVRTTCQNILDARKVDGATITISPSSWESAAQRSWITVKVTAPGGNNTAITGWFYDTLVVDGEATMMKEF